MDKIQKAFEQTVEECSDQAMTPEERRAAMAYFRCGWLKAQHFNQLTPAEHERIAILVEELGEAQQAIGKILRHGYDSYHPNRPDRTNRDDLEKELGHIRNAQKMLIDATDLRWGNINHYQGHKETRISEFLHHQQA